MPAGAQPALPPDAEIGPVSIRFTMNAFASGFAMSGLWARLAPVYGGGSFPKNGQWGDAYLRPGALAEVQSPIGTVRAGLSASWGGTIGADLYNYSGRSTPMLEDAWLGLKTQRADAPPGAASSGFVELRGGRFSECFDGGFLLCQATVNGSERGLIMQSPRTAWRIAGLAKAGISGATFTAAYLEPNNLDSFQTHDAFAYLSAGYAQGGWDLGAGAIRALRSTYAYPGNLAPFVLIPDGRDGLQTWQGRAAWRGEIGDQTEFAVKAIGAVQNQSRIDLAAWGGLAEAAIATRALPFAPRFSVAYARFSGDDPKTKAFERFDPLYYGGNGGLDGFFFGVIGSNLFLNTNLRIWRANLDLMASPQDFVKFQVLRFEADRLNSPLQFGQAVRFETGASGVRFERGVPTRTLGHEVLGSWTRLITQRVSVTGTASTFLPGAGLDALTGGHSRNWYAAGLQLTYRR